MALSNARVMFAESDIQHPMQTIFNPKVASNSVGKRFHRGKTEEKVAGFLADLLIDAPLGSHHPDGL